jgi:hypothetical protein
MHRALHCTAQIWLQSVHACSRGTAGSSVELYQHACISLQLH